MNEVECGQTHNGARSDSFSILWNVSRVISSSSWKSPPSGMVDQHRTRIEHKSDAEHTHNAVTGIGNVVFSAHRHVIVIQEGVENVLKGLLVILNIFQVGLLLVLVGSLVIFEAHLIGADCRNFSTGQLLQIRRLVRLDIAFCCPVQTALERAAPSIDGKNELRHRSL